MPDVPSPVPPQKTSAFRTPGEGSSVVISVVTIVSLFALWFAITRWS